jgi:hypothetical protein
MKNKFFLGLRNGIILAVIIWAIVWIAIMAILNGCDYPGTQGDVEVKDSNASFNIICIDDVEYIIKSIGYQGFMAVHLRPDGTPYTCSNK